MTVLLAEPVLMNAPLAQFLQAQSILSIPAFVLTAALALMFAPPAPSLRANNLNRFKLNSPRGCVKTDAASFYCPVEHSKPPTFTRMESWRFAN